MTEHTPEQEALWAARKERARRWAGTELKGYPALDVEAETEETLKAEPPEQEKKRRGE